MYKVCNLKTHLVRFDCHRVPGGLSTLGYGQGEGPEWSDAERSPPEGYLPSSFIQHGRGIIIMDFCSPPRAAARLREQKGAKTFPQTCCPGSGL